MPRKKTKVDPQITLIKELKTLSKEVKNLKDLEFVRILKHPMKFMWFSFLKGLMIGFGSVLGASMLVGIFIYTIRQIQVVPILGEFVTSIIDEVDPEGTFTPNDVNIKNGSVDVKDELTGNIKKGLDEDSGDVDAETSVQAQSNIE